MRNELSPTSSFIIAIVVSLFFGLLAGKQGITYLIFLIALIIIVYLSWGFLYRKGGIEIERLIISLVFLIIGYFLSVSLSGEAAKWIGLGSFALIFLVMGLVFIFHLKKDVDNKKYNPHSKISGYIIGLILIMLGVMALVGSISTNSAYTGTTIVLVAMILIGISLLYSSYIYPTKKSKR